MIRQRIHLRRIGIGEVVLRLMVSLLAVAGIFYGAMVVLAALKLSPHTINSVSGYRTVFHALSSITAHDITGRDRIIVAVAGVVCLIGFGPVAWRALPRPYLARTDIDLDGEPGPGRTEIAPRAIERAAELAAAAHAHVTRSGARYDTGAVEVQITLDDDEDLTATLRAVQADIRSALERQGLPDSTVDITLAGVAPTLQGEPIP